MMRRRTLLTLPSIVIASVLCATGAWAGNPHFVGAISVECDDNSVTVSGKEAGLGNEEQVFIEVSFLGQCVNPGGKKPRADNKDEFAGGGLFPVQNGKANFMVTVTAEFQPECSPPMTVEITDILVEDRDNNLSRRLGDCQ